MSVVQFPPDRVRGPLPEDAYPDRPALVLVEPAPGGWCVGLFDDRGGMFCGYDLTKAEALRRACALVLEHRAELRLSNAVPAEVCLPCL